MPGTGHAPCRCIGAFGRRVGLHAPGAMAGARWFLFAVTSQSHKSFRRLVEVQIAATMATFPASTFALEVSARTAGHGRSSWTWTCYSPILTSSRSRFM